MSRYKFKYENGRLECLDTETMVDPPYWHRTKKDAIPLKVIGLTITLFPHCCAYTELGGFQYYREYLDGGESYEIPPQDAIEATCDAVMKRLKREYTTVALASFIKLSKGAKFNAQEILDCLINKHGWAKLGDEFTNNRYTRSSHIIQTIYYQFPTRRKRNNVEADSF